MVKCTVKFIEVTMVVVLLREFEKEPLEPGTPANGFHRNTDSLGGRAVTQNGIRHRG
jgi:hypothetical protein